MSTLLEITGEDIALLNDTDLRSLIGRLCEADFRSAGLPTTGINWSGHQDAGDDGLDVTVHSDVEPPENSWVTRKATGFQVKIPNMIPSEIGKEMRPKGKLRPAIRELINESGAYIIANSKGSTTEKALRRRVEAMREAVADEPNHQRLHLGFLDRGQLATWVRNHPSLILWVRERIGRPLQGWRPYDNWANTPAGLEEEYVVDEEVRLFDGVDTDKGSSAIDGLNILRLRLSQPGVSVRFTGLSGVGKTRFVQALFDERVGENALGQSLAHYTDISDDPDPDPASFASQLVMLKVRAVLVVDNCSLELHRKLSKLCANTRVSLLTVEYDIRDDVPEGTDVFRLEPSSDNVIESLLELRYPRIGQINARSIAESAGGNARLAIALANTMRQGESLSTLRDEELFDRLFHQRHHPNADLKVSAEICSLVYSFNGNDTTSAKSELKFLARLSEKSIRELFRDVNELKSRGLVQERGVWRAVLPHAIANRLAKHALNSIPTQTIVGEFLLSGSERLIRSFTRRLSYLHDSEPAIELVKEWMSPEGWIGETNCDLNPFGLAVLENIAPVSPEATLAMLERAGNDDDGLARLHRHQFIRVMRHIAYDALLFQRSAKLLSRLALLEDPNTNDGDSARATLSQLFNIQLSGTHAPAQMRAAIIDELISSNSETEQELASRLLEAALETRHFMTFRTSSFGARPRDFGYRPATAQEIVEWYQIYLAICVQAALSDAPVANKARQVLSNHLRGLWSVGERFDHGLIGELERSVEQIHNQKPWNEGWISIKGIIRLDGNQMEPEALSRLQRLSVCLEPTSLLERARVYALADQRLHFDLEDDHGEEENAAASQWKRVQIATRQLGAEVAQDDDALEELLPELVSKRSVRLGVFGKGLADGSVDRRSTWRKLYKQLERTPPEQRQIAIMQGFLSSCAEHDPELHFQLLDSLVGDNLLGQWFPYFQLSSPVDTQGLQRLHLALDQGDADIYSFEQLAWEQPRSDVYDDDLALLIQKLFTQEGGDTVAITILSTRCDIRKTEEIILSQNLIKVSHQVLLQYGYENSRRNHPDYRLAQIAEASLGGPDGIRVTTKLCRDLAEGFKEYRIYSFDFPRLLEKLAQVQPQVFLNEFIGHDEHMFRRMRLDDHERADSPVNQIPDDVIIDWCERAPETRYPLIVSSMQTYYKPEESEELRWRPILFTILEKAPILKAVLTQIEKEIYPTSWSGSLANTLAKRLTLFTQLSEHSNIEIRDWAIMQLQKLEVAVREQRERESKKNQERFERFE